MFQNVIDVKSVQIDYKPIVRTSNETIRNRTIQQSTQSKSKTNVTYGFRKLQQSTVWKYTYPQGSSGLINYSSCRLSYFPFQSSTQSRSSTFLNRSLFKKWCQLSRIQKGPISDRNISYNNSITSSQNVFIKSYGKQCYNDSMLQYYSQNEPAGFKVVNLSDYANSNGYIVNNKQFEPNTYQNISFIFRFYLKSINERFQGTQNIFTSTVPPQTFFDTYSLANYIQPLSMWLQNKDLYVNFSTQYQSGKNYITRIKIPNVDTVFNKQTLNTILISYSIGQPLIIHLNGQKYCRPLAQTNEVDTDCQPYQIILFYKNTVGQYDYLGVLQTPFSMKRQQISAFTYLFGNRPEPIINTVDKYYEFKQIVDDGITKQFQTHFGKWYNEFVIAQSNINLTSQTPFKHSFKDLIMIGRQLTDLQIQNLFSRSTNVYLSQFSLDGADKILSLDQQTTIVITGTGTYTVVGAMWNDTNFLYNEAQFNETRFQSVSQQNQVPWVFNGLTYDYYKNSIVNYITDNVLKSIRFSTTNIYNRSIMNIGFVSKRNGMLIYRGNIFKTNGLVLDFMRNATVYTDILFEKNTYKKVYLCQTGTRYLQSFNGKKYITKVGLYNNKNQLLAVGSISKPLQINENLNVKLTLKLEF